MLCELTRQNVDLRDLAQEPPDEKEAEVRSKQLITYYRNAEAQERASSLHQATLMTLVRDLRDRGLDTRQSRIDLYAENAGRALLVEVKTIHKGNARRQARSAVGQLLEYEYFDVPPTAGDVTKAVMFSQEPPRELLPFFDAHRIAVLWSSDGELAGVASSLEALDEFVDGSPRLSEDRGEA